MVSPAGGLGLSLRRHANLHNAGALGIFYVCLPRVLCLTSLALLYSALQLSSGTGIPSFFQVFRTYPPFIESETRLPSFTVTTILLVAGLSIDPRYCCKLKKT
jgi:hypothetical protein